MVSMKVNKPRNLELRAEAKGRDDGEGRVQALVSAYDVEYPIGGGRTEVIRAGAFADAGTIPIYNQHGHARGHAPIGAAEASESRDDGLTIDGRLFLDESEDARAVYAALTAGALRSWSVGFIPTEVQEDGRTTEVLEAELREVSTVVSPANPETDTILVRSGSGSLRQKKKAQEAAMKMGRVLADMPFPGTVEDRLIHAYSHSKRFRELVRRAKQA